ncbi:MAG: hypothetical protein PHP52_02745 [Bacteroidales bacterium]|nr:hypothetical protein [Bacteroidales bacterium]MDD4150840.1 hypothetical protein [Bacteroidales bacterium]
MIAKHVKFGILLSIVLSSVINASSQTVSDNNIDGRYIIVDDFSKLFTEDENQMSNQSLIIYNIYEDESSKPLHIAVNEINNVIDFSIKSNSENFENQRKCSIILKKEAYKETFRTALLSMKVKYVFLMGEKLTINEFYTKIK